MRILFVTSEHPANLFGGLGTFTREYVKELRKHAEVKCVYFHLRDEPAPFPDETVDYVLSAVGTFEAFSPEAQILEAAASFRAQLEPVLSEFKPDVIHCNDRQTYLPFRFDDNVFYSSHLIYTDLISASCLNDLYFQEIKVERCALENSAVLGVYSDFAAKKAYRLAGGMCSPVVLPLGLNIEKLANPTSKKLVPSEKRLGQNNEREKLNISYFGRFENVQKGVNDFIYAVNLLGPSFKEKYKITYSLFGKGNPDGFMDLSLIDHIEFLQGEDLYKAYRETNIVVMPSRYEPFGFTGLEAMAAGNVLLVTQGLGMDMYAEPGVNCLSIPHDPYGISTVLREAVINYDNMSFMRENAVKTAAEWTWKRCVMAHMEIYREMCRNRISQVSSAYRIEQREILSNFKSCSDVEKLYNWNQEQAVCSKLLARLLAKKSNLNQELLLEKASGAFALWNPNQKILVLTGVYAPEENLFGENVTFVSTLEKNKNGIVTRAECLPFEKNQFDIVIAAGAWESVLDPSGALAEMERVSKNSVIILYHKGKPLPWQTIEMENDEDWINFNNSSWKYKPEQNQKILKEFNFDRNYPYGAVLYNNLHLANQTLTEITA